MTDKVQKIREEVEKLKSQLLRGACSSQIAMETTCKEEAYNEVLAILDTMKEEPVKRTPADIEAAMQEVEEKSKAFTEAHKKESADDILAQMRGEEPVSEDLEEASKEWLIPQLDKSYTNYGEAKMMELTHFDGYAMLDAIEFGANWQKTKDESITEDLGEYINELSKQFPEVSFAKLSRIAVRVTKRHREQMMAKAIDVEVKVDAGGYPYIPQMELYDYDKDVPLAKAGDRYKVILIKEG